jgi:two-component system sensor histidine kinase UhpB
VRSVQDGIMAALADLETAMTSLHEQVGLLDVLPELAHLVHEAVAGTNITATIENVGSVEYIPPDVGRELLTVAEAALTNIVAASDARHVVVTVAADAAGVWLRVVDDGRRSRSPGTDEGAMAKSLADLAERAERLDGSCTWRVDKTSGTVIDWRVPTSG